MTEPNPCPLCDKPIADTAYVCHACAKRLARDLLRTGLRWDSIEDAIGRRLIVERAGATKRTDRHALAGPWCYGGGHDCGHPSCHQVWLSRITSRQEPPLAHEDPLLVSPEAIEAADVARNVFTTWALHVADERGIGTPADRLPTVLSWLAHQATWLAHRVEAVEAFDELADAVAVVERAIDTTSRRVYLGPCDVCQRDLYASPGKDEAECKPCALIYPVQARRDWLLEKAEDRLERGAEVCRALRNFGVDVTPARLKMWAQRGRIVARGRDTLGRPLYRVGDVIAVAHRMATGRAEAV